MNGCAVSAPTNGPLPNCKTKPMMNVQTRCVVLLLPALLLAACGGKLSARPLLPDYSKTIRAYQYQCHERTLNTEYAHMGKDDTVRLELPNGSKRVLLRLADAERISFADDEYLWQENDDHRSFSLKHNDEVLYQRCQATVNIPIHEQEGPMKTRL